MSFIISNPRKFERLRNRISAGGSKKIHILTDFDRTLTTAFVNGKSRPSLISVLRDGNYLTKDYASKAHELYNKYHPIEIDYSISKEERKKAMYEWWSIHFELLIQCGLNKKDLEKVVESGKVKFRQGFEKFIDFLRNKNIPLVIMSSSALGTDTILMYFKKAGKLYDNIYVISNSFIYDKNGRVIKVKQPIIHGMSKEKTVIKDFPKIYEKIKNRKNVILLGDNPEDIEMIEGFDYESLLKIGFLNENVEENLEIYKKSFDVLILNDGPMDFVNDLIKKAL